MKTKFRVVFYLAVILSLGFSFSIALAAGPNPPNPPAANTPTPPQPNATPVPVPEASRDGQSLNPPRPIPGAPIPSHPGEESQPGGQLMPPRVSRQVKTSSSPIEAVVVRSWSGCDSINVIWDSLNATWASYGSIPIHINYSYPGLCSGTITYAALAASGADVLILSDPSGGGGIYSAAEISAIQQYASEGHNLIGTYLLLQNTSVDNRGLAPLFGLQAGLSYTYTPGIITPTYNYLEPGNPLFKDLAAPYVSLGYNQSQIPTSGTWTGAALNGARLVGINADSTAAILSYHGPNYNANYITNMPEYYGGTADKQLFYNAITYDVIDAVVIRSWGSCSSTSLIWDSLNATWPSYGMVPIHIRYSAPGLCEGTITYAALEASGADVLILSDPAGKPYLYSAAEINAIQQYANAGHNLIGTFELLQNPDTGTDNRGLAALFGLQGGLTYTYADVTPTYNYLEPGNPLFRKLGPPYASSGYTQSQVPASGTWTGAALNGARFVGINADSKAAILAYDAPNYRAVYITSMPEYLGGTADEQFFYNAITYNVLNAAVIRSWGGCSSGSLIWDSLNATWASYGSTPVQINYTYPTLCSGTITYAALEASGADVLILSDPAGGAAQYSAAEISAIQQYANEGHNLIGTYGLLQNTSSGTDNRGLAALFGLQGGLTYTYTDDIPTYNYLEPGNPLFRKLGPPYTSSGYPGSQLPVSGTWSGAALNGARMVGINADHTAAILVYDARYYHAIYIASMPEYFGGTADLRFFYNAILYNYRVFLPLLWR